MALRYLTLSTGLDCAPHGPQKHASSHHTTVVPTPTCTRLGERHSCAMSTLTCLGRERVSSVCTAVELPWCRVYGAKGKAYASSATQAPHLNTVATMSRLPAQPTQGRLPAPPEEAGSRQTKDPAALPGASPPQATPECEPAACIMMPDCSPMDGTSCRLYTSASVSLGRWQRPHVGHGTSAVSRLSTAGCRQGECCRGWACCLSTAHAVPRRQPAHVFPSSCMVARWCASAPSFQTTSMSSSP